MGSSNKRIFMVFDPCDTGHHVEYLRHLWQAASSLGPECEVHFYISHSLAEVAPFCLQDLVCKSVHMPSSKSYTELLKDYLPKFAAGGGLLFFPRLNQFLPILKEADFPSNLLKISGILFAPQTAIFTTRPVAVRKFCIDFVRALRLLYQLHKINSKLELSSLFILNDGPTALLTGRLLGLGTRCRELSDPVDFLPQPIENVEDFQSRLGIERGATVYSVLGAMRDSKGVLETLDAFSHWDASEPVALLLAGQPLPEFAGALNGAVRRFHSSANVQIVTLFNYLSIHEMSALIKVSNYLLVPYKSVYGSSGILGHAARERTPVLCNKFGLIGRLTEKYRLGRTMDARSRSSYIETLQGTLDLPVVVSARDANYYCSKNSIVAFQEAIIGSWLSA